MTDYLNNDLDKDNRFKNKVDRTLNLLDIPKTDDNIKILDKYTPILSDEKATSNYLNIRLLAMKDEYLKVLNIEDYNNDYLEVLYKDKKPLILILKEIFEDYLKNDVDIFKYS